MSIVTSKKIQRQWERKASDYPNYEVRDVGGNYSPEEGQKLRADVYPVGPLFPRQTGAITTGRDTADFVSASYHPVVRAALNFRMRKAFEANFMLVDPNESTGVYDQYPYYRWLYNEIETFLRSVIDAFSEYGHVSFKDMLKNILWNGMVSGFQVPEFNWEKRGNMWWITEVAIKEPRLFDLYINEVADIEGFRYSETGQLFAGQVMGKFAVLPYPNLRNGNWYGTGLVQPAMCAIQQLMQAEEAATRTINRLSIRPIKLEHTDDTDESLINGLANALANMDSASVLRYSLPRSEDAQGNDQQMLETIRISVLEDRASADGLKMVVEALLYFQREVNREFGVPDDIGMTTTDSGSYAKSKTEEEAVVDPSTFEDRDYVRSFLNVYFIPNAIKYNWPVLPPGFMLPRFGRHDEFSAVQLASMAESKVDEVSTDAAE